MRSAPRPVKGALVRPALAKTRHLIGPVKFSQAAERETREVRDIPSAAINTRISKHTSLVRRIRASTAFPRSSLLLDYLSSSHYIPPHTLNPPAHPPPRPRPRQKYTHRFLQGSIFSTLSPSCLKNSPSPRSRSTPPRRTSSSSSTTRSTTPALSLTSTRKCFTLFVVRILPARNFWQGGQRGHNLLLDERTREDTLSQILAVSSVNWACTIDCSRFRGSIAALGASDRLPLRNSVLDSSPLYTLLASNPHTDVPMLTISQRRRGSSS